jgi:predicted short-subunit dehydrogenase-like oxidoreductase (DUF2520 family)
MTTKHSHPTDIEQVAASASKREMGYVILGAGRLGQALALALQQAGYPLLGIWNRREPRRPEEQLTYCIGELPRELCLRAKCLLLTVSDAAIFPLAQQVAQIQGSADDQIALHCSGLLDHTALAPLQGIGYHTGSMHPLQPITQPAPNTRLFDGIAVGIEGDTEAKGLAQCLAADLGGLPFSLDGVDKRLYHAAAVFASNFAVTLAYTAEELMRQAGLREPPLPLLLPLLQAAVANIGSCGLPHALTGPISRGDSETIRQHLQALQTDAPQILPLYLALAQATVPIAQKQHHNLSDVAQILNQIAQLLQSGS